MQIDAALRGEQRVLSGCTHAHAPAAKAQEEEQRAVDGDIGRDQHRRPQRDARAADQHQRGIGDAKRLRRILLLRRPDQHDHAADQDAERDGGEDRRQHHLAGHLAHEQDSRRARQRPGSR